MVVYGGFGVSSAISWHYRPGGILSRNSILFLAAAGAFLAATVAVAAQYYVPDYTFQGSTLAGWHTLGQADWRAENGELIGTPKTGSDAGGWLVLDKSYQDVQVSAAFRCAAACKAGILLRAQKTPDGMKGFLVSLSPGDLGTYAVTLDGDGRELKREPLGRAATLSRLAIGNNPSAPAGNGSGGRSGGAGRGASTAPTEIHGGPGLNAGDWNTISVIIDADIVRAQLNVRGSDFAPSGTEDGGAGYGPIALYVGGSGEVDFKDVRYKDLAPKTTPIEVVSPNYRMQRIDDFSYAWSAAVADINHDGIPDIIAGPYYYLGPDYTVRREIYLSKTFSPGTEFALDMVNFAYDFNGDGWPDVLSTRLRPISLYINPQGESRRWDRYPVLPQVTSEIVLFKDIDGDGKPEVIYGGGGVMAYAKPDPSDVTKPWIVHPISQGVPVNIHGLGVGDINGDGRPDIVGPAGWWEQPPQGTPGRWPFHPVDFGKGGAEMGIYDVNGDGLNDVVTSLEAHGFGLAWYEQKRDKDGNISFVQHMIMDNFETKNAGDVTFTEPHGMTFADMDGDGIPDIITGKRYWSHLDSDTDPDPYGPAVLYVYHTVRDAKAPGGARFVPELINNRSGVGSTVTVADLKGDGAMDIITSTTRGTFIFWGKPNRKRAKH
jgi:Domain of Unknown Function (DUF1080)/FG-GAP-like repeat